jgi:hypothetical protein
LIAVSFVPRCSRLWGLLVLSRAQHGLPFTIKTSLACIRRFRSHPSCCVLTCVHAQDGVGIPVKPLKFNIAAYRQFVFLQR